MLKEMKMQTPNRIARGEQDRGTEPTEGHSGRQRSNSSADEEKRTSEIKWARDDQFERDVIAGLGAQPKTLPCKYFYDARGSELFERICQTPEYYVTRTELALLKEVSREVAERIGPRAWILEPGAGVGEKVQVFLAALDSPKGFVPIDISESALRDCVQAVAGQFPELWVHGLIADFTRPFSLPAHFDSGVSRDERRVVFFPGSTISNFPPKEARQFLVNLRAPLREGDFLFIGVDRIKRSELLNRAYDDAAGVTAAFNLNLLRRMARELDTDIDPDSFRHRAFYNEDECRVEMHLVSQKEQTVRVAECEFQFRLGESIHTENSYKYSPRGFAELARSAGFDLESTYSDPEQLFSLYLLRVGAKDARVCFNPA